MSKHFSLRPLGSRYAAIVAITMLFLQTDSAYGTKATFSQEPEYELPPVFKPASPKLKNLER